MKRSYYIFTPGKLMRKQNTMFFHPYENTDTAPPELPEDGQTEVLAETGEFGVDLDTTSKRVIPVDDVDSLMIFSEINFNARFLDFLTRHKIPAHLFNYYGHYNGTYYPRDYLLSGYLLVKQVTHYKHPSKRIELGQKLITGASANMLRNLKYYHDRAADLTVYIQKVEALRESITATEDIGELMGIEGNIRKAYYASFSDILGEKYDFNQRVRNPPDNAVNALISFANSLVYTTCLTEIYRTQLSPLISFLHEPGNRRFSLALDLSEIFKPILADRVLFTCLNQQRIKPKDFNKKLNFCHLSEKGRKTFVKAYEEKLNTTIEHRKLKRKVSYRRLIRLECYKLVKHITGADQYEPFKAWW